MSQLDPETARLIDEEAEHAEATRDDPYPPGVVWERRNRARSSVYSVRLGEDEIAEVQRRAESAGVPASTLVRSWILERITEPRGGHTVRGGRIVLDEADLEALREEVRKTIRAALTNAKGRAEKSA